jgi:hypothetical protein
MRNDADAGAVGRRGVRHGIGFGEKKSAKRSEAICRLVKIELEKTVGLAHNESSRRGVAVTDNRCVEPDEMVDLIGNFDTWVIE